MKHRFLVLFLMTLPLVVGRQHMEGVSVPQRARGALNTAKIVIDGGRRYQTMDGFGSSQRAWRDGHVANRVGAPPAIPEAIQDTILTQLYTELGLTRVRPHGVWFAMDPAPGDHPGGPRDVDSRIAYVQQSMAFGLKTVISENNPLDGTTAADFEKHAENTLALLLYWRAKGVEPAYQTLMNEPTENRTWADAVWHRNVIKTLGPRLRAAGLKTRLVVPDELNACVAYPIAQAIMDDPEARRYVGALAYHMYGGAVTCLEKMADLSRVYNVPVWMTEYARESGYDGSFEWAKQIHDLVAHYRVSAVDYMWGFFGEWDSHQFHTEQLVQVAFGPSATYAGHHRTSKYYVTGQFSRFVHSGDVRIGAESDTKDVLVTAYQGSDKLVVILLNDSHAQRSIVVTSRQGQLPLSLTGVRTSRSEEWTQLGSLMRAGSTFALVLPPKSVTTLWGPSTTKSRTK